jgi:tetratricopeptide (TPR) repeat protein
MATRCDDDDSFSSQEIYVPPEFFLPPFPDPADLTDLFPGRRDLKKADFLPWVNFTLENPDEIWEFEDLYQQKTYHYVSYFEPGYPTPAFVVAIAGTEDFSDLLDYTVILDPSLMADTSSGRALYSRQKEWARERLVRVLNDKALEKYDINAPEEALELINSAICIAEEPKAYLYNNRGLIRWKLGSLEEAKKDFLESISIDGANGDPYFNIGLIYFDERDLDKATAFLGRAARINPEDGQFLAELGHVYLERDDEKEARRLFNRALELAPDDGSIDFRLGHYYLYKRKAPKSAARRFQRGLKKNPSDQFAMVDLAIAHWLMGNKRKVKDIYIRIQNITGLMPYTISRLVYLNLELGEYDEALNYYRRAMDLGEQFEPEWLHFHAALVYAKTGRAQQALETLDLAVRAGGASVLEKARAEAALKDLIDGPYFKGLVKKPVEGKGG